MMSYFDLYNSAFQSVQSRASFVAEAGVKIFDPPYLTLTFQQHKDLTRKQFEKFAAYVKIHSLDTTEKLLVHLHANKLVRFIHQAARHTDMAADAVDRHSFLQMPSAGRQCFTRRDHFDLLEKRIFLFSIFLFFYFTIFLPRTLSLKRFTNHPA